MRNRYLENFDRIIKVKISGSNINSYLKRVINKHINIIQLIPVSYKEVHVILKVSEYKKLIELKSIYEITIIENLGGRKIAEKLKNNYLLLGFMIVGLVLVMLLSRIIFNIEVIHQDREIRELVLNELKRYGLVKYTFQKSYDELEMIEDKILENNKERLEWIEISLYGTKYIVRLEERKLNSLEEGFQYQSIVSKKDAVLVRIDAVRGEKVKQINDYVKAGDTVISGYIIKPNNMKIPTKAEGQVYGEVWYEVDVDYPIVYQETNLTGRSKVVYAFYFFGSRIGLFDFDEYRSFEFRSKVLIRSNFLDIRFVREEQYEALVKDEVYTEDIAKVKAIDYIKDKLKKDNNDIVEIREVKILGANSDEDSIGFKLFVRVIEDIGKVVVIDDVSIDEKKDDNG